MITDDNLKRLIEEKYNSKRNELKRGTSILVFGPSTVPEARDRELVKTALTQEGCAVAYPENLLDGVGINKGIAEGILTDGYNLIYVVLAGIGPSVEFAHYMKSEELARKFRIFQHARYGGTPSFLNEILRPFCKLHGFCRSYSDDNELVTLARALLDDYVEYTLAFGKRPS